MYISMPFTSHANFLVISSIDCSNKFTEGHQHTIVVISISIPAHVRKLVMVQG